MTPAQKLRIRRAEITRRLSELVGAEGELSEEELEELRALPKEMAQVEERLAAADLVEETKRATAPEGADDPEGGGDPLEELREAANVGEYLAAAMRGRPVKGAERELLDELRLQDGQIPLECWETRAVTPAPGTVGVNLQPLQPAVFAPSVAPLLAIEMPRVPTGTFATGTITTSLTAGPVAKGSAAGGTAAAFSVTSATVKAIRARLELSDLDVAAVGQANFEAVLKENLSLIMSDKLDDQILNGDGKAPNLAGILSRLTDPTDPTNLADWDAFARLPSDHVDGKWATSEEEVMLLVGVASYRLAARTWRQPAAVEKGSPSDGYGVATPGSRSAARFLRDVSGGMVTNSRMPAASSNVQAGIAYRTGRRLEGGGQGLRTAVCPVWSEMSIDDVYSGSAKGERYFTLSILLGDVILTQPDAYARFDLKVA